MNIIKVGRAKSLKYNASGMIVSPEGASPCVVTRADINNLHMGLIKVEKGVRTYTPKECFRLMGFTDKDFEKLSFLKESTLYHLAGDGIAVNVLEAVFESLNEENE